MTIEEIMERAEEYAGFCTTCKAVTVECGVEPDAHGYKCPECENYTVMGIEDALITGQIPVTDDGEDE